MHLSNLTIFLIRIDMNIKLIKDTNVLILYKTFSDDKRTIENSFIEVHRSKFQRPFIPAQMSFIPICKLR